MKRVWGSLPGPDNHSYRHGKTGSKVHVAWTSMLNRCENPKASAFRYYGGRGIRVCKEWHVFENFLRDMGEPPSKSHSLDRIDGDGDYCKENCRWASKMTQSLNRRNTHKISIDGKQRPLVEVARELGVRPGLARERLRKGMPLDRVLSKGRAGAITSETLKEIRAMLARGRTSREVSEAVGVSRDMIHKIRQGRAYANA